MKAVKHFCNLPIRNRIALVVILLCFPIDIAAHIFEVIADKLHDFAGFMARWMEFWTGVRKS